MTEDISKQVATVTKAYEIERGCWDWDKPVPAHCDASYFRLRRFVALDAPDLIIESEINLLYRKIALMRFTRLGVPMH